MWLNLSFYFNITKRNTNSVNISLDGDLVKEEDFHAGCAVVISAPMVRKTLLAGGTQFETQFGTFYAPNVSIAKSTE